MQHTITALQSLRTDREYILAGTTLKKRFPKLGEKIPPEMVQELLNPPAPSGDGDQVFSFPNSVNFIINQYEFMAVAVRMGVMDEDMLRETVRGSICGLVESFAPYILEVRKDRRENWENLIWLYLRFTEKRGLDLPEIGPLRRPGWPNR